METPCWRPSEFCYKNVNLFFEELINIKVILFLIHELFRQQNSLKLVIFFNLHDSSLGRHVNAASRKSLEIQVYSITKPRTLLHLEETHVSKSFHLHLQKRSFNSNFNQGIHKYDIRSIGIHLLKGKTFVNSDNVHFKFFNSLGV